MRKPLLGIRETPHLARARMVAPLARLGVRPKPAVEPLHRALRTTLLGRVQPEERAWIARIEARRAALSTNGALTGLPAYHPEADASGERFTIGDPETTVGAAATVMSLSPHWCVLLMRLVREATPRSCLELGTGFGISTAYQAAALELNGSGTITTLEGSPAWARLAEEGFDALGLPRVRSCVGPIDETLPQALDRSGPFDFAFIDAEHQAEATVDHFEAMLPSLSEGAIIVLDDVDWPGVRQAQALIGEHPRVSASLMIGRLGVSVIGGPVSPSP